MATITPLLAIFGTVTLPILPANIHPKPRLPDEIATVTLPFLPVNIKAKSSVIYHFCHFRKKQLPKLPRLPRQNCHGYFTKIATWNRWKMIDVYIIKSVFLFAWFENFFLEKHQKAVFKWQVTGLPFFGYTLFFVAIWKFIGYLGTCAILFGYMELAFHANFKPSNWIQKLLGKLGFLGYSILFGYMKSYNRKVDTW